MSLNARVSEALEFRIQQLEMEWPVVSVECWDEIGQANEELQEDDFINGRRFLSNLLNDYIYKRAFRGPVGAYDVSRDLVSAARPN